MKILTSFTEEMVFDTKLFHIKIQMVPNEPVYLSMLFS